MQPRLDLRLRDLAGTGLLGLPWLEPLADWSATDVDLRDLPVGPSRHLVRFVHVDGVLWALKELPERIAVKEYTVLRELEGRRLPAVQAAGVVVQPFADNAILVTRFLAGSWQYRRLLMRLPLDRPQHRERLLDAMAGLLVDLHRNGVFWGDCSLANTLFTRDGPVLQAWMVDAETSEVHPTLSNGQRQMDLDILVDNVAGGLVDLAVRLGEPTEVVDDFLAEAESVRTRYEALWDILFTDPVVRFDERFAIEQRLRRLNDLGFAVDEVRLAPAADGRGDAPLQLHLAVAGRQYHADVLRNLTGLRVGEGQARVLLNDLRSYQARRPGMSDEDASREWRWGVLQPGMMKAHRALGGVGDPIQAYCDLLEVRWLLSEQAARNVGDDAALARLADRTSPAGAAAEIAIAEAPTGALPATLVRRLSRLQEDSEEAATFEGDPDLD